MSEISDMYSQILSLQEKLLKTKIQEGIKAIKEKRELSSQEGRDFAFFPDDIELLKKIINYKIDDLDYGEETYVGFSNRLHAETLIFKIDGEYISIHQYESAKVIDIESIRQILDELKFSEEKKLKAEELLKGLVDIDLEQLKRRIPKQKITIEEDEHEYDEDGDYEYDEEYEDYYDRTEPHDWDVIWNILRNKIVDYKANEMFGENCNFCEIGAYSDMPGEEQIAVTLNSMSIETLKEYFKEYPEDIALFEQMRSKYPNIQSLAEREAEEHSGGDEFVSNIVGYATRKVEVRDQNAQAAQLAQDYEQQLPANEQSLDDE